jgi:hypothetical protein
MYKDMYICIVHCVNAGNNHQEVCLLLRSRKRDNGATRVLAGDEDVAAKEAAIEKQQQPLPRCTSRLIMMMAGVMRIYCFAFLFMRIHCSAVTDGRIIYYGVCGTAVCLYNMYMSVAACPNPSRTEVSDTRISIAIPPEY